MEAERRRCRTIGGPGSDGAADLAVTGYRTAGPRYSEEHEFPSPVRPCAHR
ncbi:predicted protein [Streptomyces filamentosus NRRL 15998]|uniref:Predicted protein n=1 Tax=Streptomyces filamentosus NRRL 15998 TaxID=457431 RepID=D6ARM2_STRFL|nr:predicted protein [Streptomyces filamentosus NRRL 15998]